MRHCGCSVCVAMDAREKELAKFYMVVIDGGQAPNARHPDKDTARKEAERLACKSNNKAYVLEAIEVCEPVGRVQWTTMLEPGV